MTPQDAAALEYLRAFVLVNGRFPSIPEILKGLKLKSNATVHRRLHRLVAAGHLSQSAPGCSFGLARQRGCCAACRPPLKPSLARSQHLTATAAPITPEVKTP